ncbi:site-specific integrase [Gaoshiqia sp. Z1-71]|uniref:site-specific integrase n=1 Tax=Gaoshiqia hydrogeniformans TaxID=3290090 RepID=UPI003BF80B32
MAKIHFHINKSKTDKNGFVPIRAKISVDSTARYKVIEKVKPRYWNTKKQRVSPNRESEPYNRHKEINELLEKYEDKAKNYFNDLKFQGILIDLNIVEGFLQGKLLGNSQKDFWTAYDEFMDVNQSRVAYNTTRNRNTAKNFIQRYQEHYRLKLQFPDIDLQFFEKLYDYAFEIEELENNSFAAYVAKFKSFLEWSIDKGYYNSLDHRKYSFAEKDKSVVCLTPDEFKALYNYKFGNNRLSKARDLYCFGCLTGLRFSDVASLRYEHFQDGYIVKNILKTKQDDRIPILPQAQAIIDRYNDGSIFPLPRLSNPKLNEYIKECCKLAGITAQTIRLEFRGNKVIETVHPKYELITAHTARKTFITIGFMKGLDVKIIKSITGHKKEATFDKYLKIADEMKKEEMFKAFGSL